MPIRNTSARRTIPGAALLAAAVLLTASPAAAVDTRPPDPDGCCKIPAGCVVLRHSLCVAQPGGKFFANHKCSRTGECVFVHAVRARAELGLSLDCGGTSPLVGSAALLGETKIARRNASSDPTIETEIVQMELTGTSSTFGPMVLSYEEPAPPSGESDLSSGEWSGRLAADGLRWTLEGSPCPDVLETLAPVPLEGQGIFSFPPLGGSVASPEGLAVPLGAGGAPAGTLDRLSLEFLDVGEPDCRRGQVPAATLLVPYFEVDLDDSNGTSTLFAVVNRSDQFVLARVVLWTDLAVPTLTFWLYLSPSDVQTVNLRDPFEGRLPDTSAVLADPQRPVLDFDPCTPGELAPGLTAEQVAALRAAHTGRPLPGNGEGVPPGAAALALPASCAGIDRGDAFARGYLTVDAVRTCAFAPTVATYERGAELFDRFELTGQNALWGDYFYVDPGENFAQSETAIHRPYEPQWLDPGVPTFYGRYNGFDATDGRLPLASHYQVRFLQGGPFDGGTRLIVWRDNQSSSLTPVTCGAPAPWQPLGEAGVVVWDEQENAVRVDDLSAICPQAAGVSFACDLTAVPFPFGWLDLDLGQGDGTPAQAAVVAVLRASGRYSVGHQAVPVNDLCAERKAIPIERFDQAIDACEYEVLGGTDGCPHSSGDRIFVGCSGGRCALPGAQGHSAVTLCPGRDCGLALRRLSYCAVRSSGARYRRVERCAD